MAVKMQYRPTAVGLAFFNMANSVHNHNRVTRNVLEKVARNEREFCVREPAWNAHLSFKTAQELQQAGIL